MRLKDIIIKDEFKKSIPNKDKIDECYLYFRENGLLDKTILLNRNNELVDGYVRYLVLRGCGIENTEQVRYVDDYRDKITTYVYGVHPNDSSQKEYVWRMKEGEKYIPEIDSTVYVKTKFGVAPVTVTRVIITNKCPVPWNVKKVIRW